MKLFSIAINLLSFFCLTNAYYIENDNINNTTLSTLSKRSVGTSLIKAISSIAGRAIGNYGVQIAKTMFTQGKEFYIIWSNECEAINICPNTYTEICSTAPLRLRYVAKQDDFSVYAYNRYNQAGKSWVECARVAPPSGSNVCHKITFCSGEPRSGLTIVGNTPKSTNELRVGPTYAQWVKECYINSCSSGKQDEYAHKLAKRLKGK